MGVEGAVGLDLKICSLNFWPTTGAAAPLWNPPCSFSPLVLFLKFIPTKTYIKTLELESIDLRNKFPIAWFKPPSDTEENYAYSPRIWYSGSMRNLQIKKKEYRFLLPTTEPV